MSETRDLGQDGPDVPDGPNDDVMNNPHTMDVDELVDPTHPHGPGGMKKDDEHDVKDDPAIMQDPSELADPTHPHGPGGRKQD